MIADYIATKNMTIEQHKRGRQMLADAEAREGAADHHSVRGSRPELGR